MTFGGHYATNRFPAGAKLTSNYNILNGGFLSVEADYNRKKNHLSFRRKEDCHSDGNGIVIPTQGGI